MATRLDTRRLDAILSGLDPRGEELIAATARQVQGIVKDSMVSGHGRTYKVSKSGALHQASAPGEPPAPDIGNLKNSIEATQQRRLLWWVHDGVEYGLYLELGTSRMAPRPFMVPAVEKIRPQFYKRWAELFK